MQVIQRDGSILLTNKAFHHLIGSDPWRPPGYAANLSAAFKGEVVRAEPAWRRQGTEAPDDAPTDLAVSATFFPIFGPAREVLHVAVLFNDETVQKKAQLVSVEAEERYRRLFDSMADPVYIFDFLTNTIETANPAWCREFGYELSEAVGMEMLKCSAEPEKSRAGIEATVRSPEAAFLIPLRWMKRKDGSTFPTEISGSRFRIRGRVKVIGMVRNITTRRKAEQDLIESEAKFRQLAESIQEVFWISSPDSGTIHYVSPAYEKIWGRTPESLYAHPAQWIESMHPDDRATIVERLRSKARGEYQAEYRIIRPDGSTRWIRDRGFPVEESDGRLSRMAGIAMDITEQRQLSQQLSQSQKLEAIGRLAGGVSHDFNNMLTAIIGYADVLKESFPKDDQRAADLDEIRKTAERAASLTRQLLAFSRQQVMEPRVLSMNVLILETKNMLQRLIGEDIGITHVLPDDLGTVYADPGQLGQVILNLMVNACDAMPNGGRISIETKNARLETGEYVMLSIADTGEGIDPKNLPKIFEPFFTTKETGKGTGLGLSTVYGIVQQCGGVVTVESEVGVGTTFRIYIPRAQETATTYQGARAANTEKVRGVGAILLVEDEEAVRRLATRILAGCGYTVSAAATPGEALRLIRKPGAHFDLLITDVMMPEMNGQVLAEKVLEVLPGLKMLFMSGYTDEAIAHKGLLAPGLNFLGKPFSAITLSHKVKEVLEPT